MEDWWRKLSIFSCVHVMSWFIKVRHTLQYVAQMDVLEVEPGHILYKHTQSQFPPDVLETSLNCEFMDSLALGNWKTLMEVARRAVNSISQMFPKTENSRHFPASACKFISILSGGAWVKRVYIFGGATCLLIASVKHPPDYYLSYTIHHAMRAVRGIFFPLV